MPRGQASIRERKGIVRGRRSARDRFQIVLEVYLPRRSAYCIHMPDSLVGLRACTWLLLLACIGASVALQRCRSQDGAPVATQVPRSAAGVSEGLIRFDLQVTGPNGDAVTGLEARDFTLLDDGNPAEIATFQEFNGAAPPPVPVELIFVLDLVDLNSLRNKPKGEAAQIALENFLRSKEGRLDQPVSVYVLTKDGLSGSAEPSRDGNVLARMLATDSLPRRRRSPADDWFHIMPLQAEALGAIALEQRLRPARKVLVWTGPGWAANRRKDERLFLGIVELSTRLREARVTVWGAGQWPYPRPGEDAAASLNPEFSRGPGMAGTGGPVLRPDIRDPEYMDPVKSPADARLGNVALAVLAAHTGGGTILARSIYDAIEKLAAGANSYYSITFNPARTTQVDEYHELKLEVAGSNLTAHAISGYYDEPVFYDQPPAPEERLSVAQLDAMVARGSRGGEPRIAKELEHAELTERLSAARRESLKARLPDSNSQQSLEALADRSEFLPPPRDEVLAIPAPDAAAQGQMLARMASGLHKTIEQLPDLFATRTTSAFNEPAIAAKAGAWKQVSADESLHLTGTSRTTVLIRNGREVVDRTRHVEAGEHNLLTEGTFGPILNLVLSHTGEAHSRVAFSRWERGIEAPVAVFRYAASKRADELQVDSCCTAGPAGTASMPPVAGFHGEIAIDPATGAIVRLTVEADLQPGLPVTRSAVMVEYASISIGGKTCICPVHSVVISRQRIEWSLHEWSESFTVYGRYETLLNDVTFSRYHLFGSESKILPGYAAADGRP